jgi:tRNA(Ile2)-agmatinylcytidine synthase
MSSIVLGLIKGDKVCVGGGIRKASKTHPRILNLEFIDIIDLKKNMEKSNPLCRKCHKTMKSKGQNQGYRCVKCGKTSKNKNNLEIPRKIKKKLYLPQVSAHRHLSRPLTRFGMINRKSKFNESASWFSVYEN